MQAEHDPEAINYTGIDLKTHSIKKISGIFITQGHPN
jgi:hypothetical protein